MVKAFWKVALKKFRAPVAAEPRIVVRIKPTPKSAGIVACWRGAKRVLVVIFFGTLIFNDGRELQLTRSRSTWLFASILLLWVGNGVLLGAPEADDPYLQVVRRYADTMIERGRDYV